MRRRQMKKVLVIGASGSLGYAIVNELISKEMYEIVVFARTQSKLDRLFGNEPNVTIVSGNVFKIDELRAAAQDTDIIFHAMNVPYHEWEERQPVLLRNILSVAKEVDAKLVVVDNIYSYGRVNGEKVKEDFPKRPHTKKGKIRLKLEIMIKESGVQFLIAHLPDFYGPHAKNTVLYQTFQRVVQNRKTVFVGNPQISREYIYTPDGARALVELSRRNNAYGQNWNVPGVGVITGNEILQILRRSGYSKGMTTITKFMVRVVGLFSKDMKEYVEMFYLNEEPVVLSGEKLQKELGVIPQTPYEIGILKTLGAFET
jgi:nucleoside-diphosphate-sugar epimerase